MSNPHRAIIKVTDDKVRDQYNKIMEAVTANAQIGAHVSYLLGIKLVYEQEGKELPENIQHKLDVLNSTLPGLGIITGPEDVMNAISNGMDSLMLELVVLLLEASISGKIEYNNLDNKVADIIFSEDDVEVTTQQLEEMIEALSGLRTNKIGIA